jgi:hypothetical protein
MLLLVVVLLFSFKVARGQLLLLLFTFRVLVGPVYAAMVYWAFHVQTTPGEFPWYFYVAVLVCYAVHQVRGLLHCFGFDGYPTVSMLRCRYCTM